MVGVAGKVPERRVDPLIALDQSGEMSSAVRRALELVTSLSPGKREALVDMPFADALRLLEIALPTNRASADELIGPFYDARGLAERWHISVQAVHKRADKGKRLLKVLTKDDVALFPSFQFDAAGEMLPGLPAVMGALTPAVSDSWTIARWLKAPSSRAQGQSPAELLRAGQLDRVLTLATSFSERLSA